MDTINVKYYEEKDKLKRAVIRYDLDPLNPREDENNIGHLCLWHSRYKLGDISETGRLTSKRDVLLDIVMNHIPHDEIYDEDDLDNETLIELIKKRDNIVLLKCYLYDHSGLSIACETEDGDCPGYPYNDRWDAGAAGFIWADIDDLKKVGINTDKIEDVKKTLRNHLESEIYTYNMYLEGRIYGIVIEEYDVGDGDWIECDACWGFMSDKYGDELANEIIESYCEIEATNFYNKPEELGYKMTPVTITITRNRYQKI